MSGVRLRLALVIPILLAVASCDKARDEPAAAPSSVGIATSAAPSPTGDPAERAAATAAAMSDSDLAGQVLMPYAYGSDADTVDKASAVGNQGLAGVDTPAQMVGKFHLGGVILVGFTAQDPTGSTNAATNVADPRQVRKLTDGLQTAARQAGMPPLTIGTDQEYGDRKSVV